MATSSRIDELVSLADLIAVPCLVTSEGPHRAGGLVAARAVGRLLTIPVPGIPVWIVIDQRSFRSGPVCQMFTLADAATVQLVVRTMEGRYTFEFSRASIHDRVDRTTHPVELAN